MLLLYLFLSILTQELCLHLIITFDMEQEDLWKIRKNLLKCMAILKCEN